MSSGFFHRYLRLPLEAQLRQGSDPKGLAASCAVGFAIGVFPIFGATTSLGAIIGMIFRLNQVVLQSVNYLMAPLQLMAIPIFGYLASRIGSGTELSFMPSDLIRQFKADPRHFLSLYGWLGLRAVALWSILIPPLAYLVYRIALKFIHTVKGELK